MLPAAKGKHTIVDPALSDPFRLFNNFFQHLSKGLRLPAKGIVFLIRNMNSLLSLDAVDIPF